MKLIILFLFSLTSFTVLHAEQLVDANSLIKKYKITSERPKSCPLQSTKFSDLLAKTEAIKNIFKSNCLLQDENKITEVLNSVTNIQDEIKTKNIFNNTPASDTTVTAGTDDNALSGVKFSNLFSNINNMIQKNECNLEDGRVLQMTADLVYDSTQIGLLAGNQVGVVVAGGGFIISSALRLIDMMIKQKFDFEKNQDRQTFIKLNCSFYDIRHELENQGALEIEDTSSRKDLLETKSLIADLTKSLQLIEKEKVDQKNILDSMDQKLFSSQVGDITFLKKNLTRVKEYLSIGIVDSAVLPSETQKLIMISNLAKDHDLLVAEVNGFKKLNISSIPMLDEMFLQELAKFDSLDIVSFGSLLSMKALDFNDNIRSKMLFHVMHILGDINTREDIISLQNTESKKLKVNEIDQKIKSYTTAITELKKIEERLNRVVYPKDYSASDDGSDNMVSLLENYKNISEQIYGDWGEKFLKYTTLKSSAEANIFQGKVDHFYKKYGEQLKRINDDLVPSAFMCQDIQRIRVSYKYADSLVQEGYDFIITNKDLFSSDSKSFYNASLDEETNGGSSSIEKIQRHYKSTILALKKLKNEPIDPVDEKKYLSKSFMSSAFLGKSMLEVSNAKVIARTIQDKFIQLNCNKVLIDDLN